MSVLLGIDVGTSGCKVILIDETGAVLGSETIGYPLYVPHENWSEQIPADWWQATCDGTKSALAKSGLKATDIDCIGLSAQMHGMVAMDEKGEVIRPAVLWNDQRTGDQCAEIKEMVGGLDKLMTYTNNNMLPGYTGGKILWLKENEPENYARLRMVLNPKDYIRYELTGDYATEVSDASGTGLFDVENRKWSYELIDILGFDRSIFPKCYESPEITGELSAKAAEQMGLVPGIPVCGGGGDAVIQTTGTGLLREGILATIVGTSGIVSSGLQKFVKNNGGSLQIFCNNAPGLWHAMGVSLCSGEALRWLRDKILFTRGGVKTDDHATAYDQINEWVAASTPGAKKMLFLPYLTGERCPYSDPYTRGAFVGLNIQHTSGDMARAVMEGVIFNMRQMYELMDTTATEIRTSGGGAKSQIWRQIQADIFQLPVKTVSGSEEGGAYGAAMVAGVACKAWKSLDEAAAIVKTETEVLPNPANKQVYDEMFEQYKKIYGALAPIHEAFRGM